MKAISPVMATVILIVLVVTIAAALAWFTVADENTTEVQQSSELEYGCASALCMSSPADTEVWSSKIGAKLLRSSGGLDWVLTTNGTDLKDAEITFRINENPFIRDDYSTISEFMEIKNVTIKADKSDDMDVYSVVTARTGNKYNLTTDSIDNLPITVFADVQRSKVTYGKTIQTITIYINNNNKTYSDNVQITGYGLEPLEHIKEIKLEKIIELQFLKPYYQEGLERIAELKGEGYGNISITNEAGFTWRDEPTTKYIVLMEKQ